MLAPTSINNLFGWTEPHNHAVTSGSQIPFSQVDPKMKDALGK
jgi:hypothetical protein